MAHSRQAADSEWKLLQRLGEQLVQQSTPQEQCQSIVETAGKLLSASIRVWLASPSYPLPGTPEIELETLPEAEATPLVQRALASAKIEYDHTAADGTLDPSTKPTAVATPLNVKGTILGIMLAERTERAGFTERDLSLMEAISTHAAAAMEITRQEKIKDWRLEQLALVRSVSAQISSLPNIDLICERVTQLILRKFNYYYVAIFTLEENQGVLRFRGSASQNPSAPIPQDFVVQPGDGIIGTVGQSGTEIIALDVQTESRYRFLDVLPETRSEAALPLKIENRILGVLDVQSDQVNAFHESDMLVLRAMADNIAMAIESKRLYTSLERRADQISLVFEVGHALTSILDLDELLDEVVHRIQDRFGYPFVHVYTVHPGRRLVIYQTGSGERSVIMRKKAGIIRWMPRKA
jgi:GAF domain-containing protein